ncbi:MAG TPA: efflux RND transporter permease subunit [Burkholderiaceae bacterium]|nr:efflux RND transporter permease subunit [Burkholderiaceae bacterium]
MWFTQVSLRNPVFATMVILAFVVMGLFSIQRLQVDQFPNIDFPVVVVTTEYPGAAPEIVESEVTQKVEEAVNTIAGINALTSRSYESQSVVIIEFGLHMNGRRAAEDVREKIALLKPTLRTEVKEPKVLRFDPASRAIWSVAVLPDAAVGTAPSPAELTQWSEQVLKKRLENVRGVGAVNLVGGTRRAINIELNLAAMEALGISADQVVAAVRSENQDAPLGSLRTQHQEKVVQLQARMVQPDDFNRIIVTRRGGQPVFLNQVARIVDSTVEQENLALFNGERTLLLQVQKTQDENTIAVVNGLQSTLKDIQAQLPPGYKLAEVQDGSRPIRVGVANVRQTLIEGAILTVLIVFLFLNSWRSTIITGLTLPIALIGTFMVMNLFGFTINMLTLMALSLSVGLLIDDAIVVRENIVRHLQMGKTPYNAAMDGTREIGLAVLATTLSIVAVFLPIGFMEGIIGKFFHEFGITVAAAILISMFVSFTLDPMLSSVWHDPAVHLHTGPDGTGHDATAPQRRNWYDRTIGRLTGWIDRAQDDLSDSYQRVLAWSLTHKLTTLAAAGGIFVLSVAMVPLLGTEFVPKADFSETSLTFHTPAGSSLEATEAKARQVEAIAREFPEVRYSVTTINTGNAAGKIYANIYLRLVDRKDRSVNADAMSARLRERLRSVSGINVTHVGLLDAVGGNKQIELSLQGPDLDELERLTQDVMSRIRAIPGLVDLDSSVKPDKPTVELKLKPSVASDLGAGVSALASPLRIMVAGQTVGNWRAADAQTYDVIVRLPAADRRSLEDLAHARLVVGTLADGSPRVVRVDQLASVEASTGANQINRRNLTREVAINANAYSRTAGDVSADIRKVLDATQLPPGYRYQFGGSTKNMQESFAYAVSALAMAVIFIYMILASQFKSFLQPLALMTSLPLTLIGVVLALMMFQSSMSMFSVIGIIMLMGLVTKNAILLVDFAIRAREGTSDHPAMGRTDALLMAARVRLRPILMTTLAMVFGMVPLAFALSEGSEQRAPMGQAVIGGVITSSILTLVVVPVVYCYMDDLGQWLKRKFVGGAPPPDAPPGSAEAAR